MPCTFCRIAAGELGASFVAREPAAMAFLDARPLFKGHTLVVPIEHIETLADAPAKDLAALFGLAQRVARAMEDGLEAQGSFVAINNKVSQSVPHLHVHVVPRRRGDGLRGFFWPRTRYENAEEEERFRGLLADAASRIR